MRWDISAWLDFDAERNSVNAIGYPSVVGRLFRTEYLDTEILEVSCQTLVGADISMKRTSESGCAVHVSIRLSVRSRFRAHSSIVTEMVRDPSFSMRVEFVSKGLPDILAEADASRV